MTDHHTSSSVSGITSVIIPSMDEGDNLARLLPRIADSYDVIVVEGHDLPRTTRIVHAIRPSATVIAQTRRGKGNALMCGCAVATGDYVVMLDADGSADPEEIPKMVRALADGADMAKGSRYLSPGGSDDLTALRSLGNRGFTILTNLLFRTRFTDLCYGYNAFTRAAIPKLGLPYTSNACGTAPRWGDGFEIETLFACRAALSGARIVEVPSYEYSRVHGASNLHAWRDGKRVLRTIIHEWLTHHGQRLYRFAQSHPPEPNMPLTPQSEPITQGALKNAPDNSGCEPDIGIDVVVCVHHPERENTIAQCIHAVAGELLHPDHLYIVVDHCEELYAALTSDYGHRERITIVRNTHTRGLSGARDTGVAAGHNPIVCFIDDDAIPRAGWAHAVRTAGWADTSHNLVAIGGAVHPQHINASGTVVSPPRWLPTEHGWLIGCDYHGIPGDGQPIRNPIGAAMAIRRTALAAAGRFACPLGRTGLNAAGGEETDMLLRIRDLDSTSTVVRTEAFAVDHRVPPNRRRVGYLLARAYGEGQSKARLSSARHGDVSAERKHLGSTIPRAIAAGLAAPLRGDAFGPIRALLSMTIVAATGAGFLLGRSGSITTGSQPAGSQPAGSQPAGAQPEHATPTAPLVSVVVCTDGRSRHLRQALRAVLVAADNAAKPCGSNATSAWTDTPTAQSQPITTEILLVDNSPGGTLGTRADIVDMLNHNRLRVVRAPKPGLSRARNVGINAAVGDYIAFTDDDTIVDPHWIAHLIDGFRATNNNDIWCVTGRTTAFSTDNPAHRWFETTTGFDKGSHGILWDRGGGHIHNGPTSAPGLPSTPASQAGASQATGSQATGSQATADLRPLLYPWPAGCFGSGNNMAFQARVFHALGGFAEELGAGRATRGGEDLDMFRLIILAGGHIAYQPSALARHHHRDSLAQLKTQMFGYGAGMAASLARCALDNPRHGLAIARAIPKGLRHLVRMRTNSAAPQPPAGPAQPAGAPPYPPTLVFPELAGYAAGLPLFIAARLADALAHFRPHANPTDQEVPLD